MAGNWRDRLERRLKDYNKSAVDRQLGWREGRLSQLLGRGQILNAIDAVRLCRFLGVTVEEVFGDSRAGRTAKTRSKAVSAIEPVARLLAYAIARGRYAGQKSLSLVGETEIIEGEDWQGEPGFVPLLAPIAAGEPREATDGDYLAGRAEAYARFTIEDPKAFALRVDGDSMSPDFKHGNVIVVSPKIGLPTDHFRDGRLAVVIFGSERTATFKLIWTGDSRDKRRDCDYLLKPINAAYPKMRLKVGEIAAILPVLGLIKPGRSG
ncbi:MAG: S24 family peptidase [Planctomycetota bacterium]